MRTASLQRVRRAPLGASSPCFSLWEPFVPRLHACRHYQAGIHVRTGFRFRRTSSTFFDVFCVCVQ